MVEKIKRLSHARFLALSYSRSPYARLIAEELEWYADNNEYIIAALTMDNVDEDYGYIILGRDERMLFRAIDLNVSFENKNAARSELEKKIAEYSVQGGREFPQGDLKKKKCEIYRQRVPVDKLHPFYKRLTEEVGYSPAKEIIQEIAYAFEDPDGNYIEQFQSSGFNARLWELFLYAFLHEEDVDIKRDYSAPDYMCEKHGIDFCIEATTVNPSENDQPTFVPKNASESEEYIKNYMPIKFGSALYSKLKKRYWESEHVKGLPLIIAIEDFHQELSLLWSRTALINYLYGYHHSWHKDDQGKLIVSSEIIKSHKHWGKEIPSGFFFLPDAENISAVLFSNSATIAKFNRMGKLAGFGSDDVKMIRRGNLYNPDPNATDPMPFVIVIEPDKTIEHWSEGLSMFHNPRALYPIPEDLFPDIAHHRLLEDNLVGGVIPPFFPLASITHIISSTKTDKGSL